MSMYMSVVNIREMRMAVGEGMVLVFMRLGLLPIPAQIMPMLVMLIVGMRVAVFQRLMNMFMFMPLREVKQHANAHQSASEPKNGADRLTQPQQSSQGVIIP